MASVRRRHRRRILKKLKKLIQEANAPVVEGTATMRLRQLAESAKTLVPQQVPNGFKNDWWSRVEDRGLVKVLGWSTVEADFSPDSISTKFFKDLPMYALKPPVKFSTE